jgi:hypothetical protein
VSAERLPARGRVTGFAAPRVSSAVASRSRAAAPDLRDSGEGAHGDRVRCATGPLRGGVFNHVILRPIRDRGKTQRSGAAGPWGSCRQAQVRGLDSRRFGQGPGRAAGPGMVRGMPKQSRDREPWSGHDAERARRRGLEYLLDRASGASRPRPRGRVGLEPLPAPDRGGGLGGDDRRGDRGAPAGLRVSAAESFDVPCETEVRGPAGETRRCGAPAREYRVYMNRTWQRWVICSAHAAYYRSWGADLSVLVD